MKFELSAFSTSDRPTIMLKSMSGTPIQVLGSAYDARFTPHLNEVSEIEFSYPAESDGVACEGYDDIVGMTTVDVENCGIFVLQNPEEKNDGIKRFKSCKGYSLEYTLTFVSFGLEKGVYNLWNPVAQSSSLLGILLERCPDWTVGYVSPSLIGKYRMIDETSGNVYDFIKSTLQESYQCIVDFDTYQKKIYVNSVDDNPEYSECYLSLNNLLKEVSITEDSDHIVTVLDVNGADGVNIRSVNPTGTNKIYNLDYFMKPTYLPSAIITKWSQWKSDYEANQLAYFNLSIELMVARAEKSALEASASDTRAILASKQDIQSTYIEAEAQGIDRSAELAQIKAEIEAAQADVDAIEAKIATVDTTISGILESMQDIVSTISIESYFTAQEIDTLRPYFKEDSVSESTFVAPTVESYASADVSGTNTKISASCTDTAIDVSVDDGTKLLFSARGGSITVPFGSDLQDPDCSITAELVRGVVEKLSNGKVVISCYLGGGTISKAESDDDDIISGCISIVCESGSVTHDDDSFTFTTNSGSIYFTRNLTEFEQTSIEWDLYDFGVSILNKLAYPSFEFSVSAADFTSLEEFDYFKSTLALGKRIYVDTGVDGDAVLEPILIGMSVNLGSPGEITLEFGSKYTSSDSSFALADLLEQSVSMGKSFNSGKFTYSEFVDSGASTTVKKFMESALDVAKNAIISASGQAISWDSSGIHLRKKEEQTGEYDDEQIRMINNNIVFTDDGWLTAKMAIGKFSDTNAGDCWGIAAPNIVGTMIAGSNLIIESQKKDGNIAVFKVDGEGAALHNASFSIYHSAQSGNKSQILLDPVIGIAVGEYPVTKTEDDETVIDETKAKFWVDTDGDVHFSGTLEGSSGLFTGELMVGGSTAFRVDASGNVSIGGTASSPAFRITSSGDIKIGGSDASPVFHVDPSGNLTATSGSFTGTVDATSGTFRGAVYATSGSFTGTVDASAFLINGVNALTNDDKIRRAFLDTGKMSIDAANGNITLAGDIHIGGNIVWDQGSSGIGYDGVWEALKTSSTADGIYSYTEGGVKHIGINAGFIRAGTIDTDSVLIGTTNGGVTSGYADSANVGAYLYGGNNKDNPYNYVVATDISGVRMSSKSMRSSGGSSYILDNSHIGCTQSTSFANTYIHTTVDYVKTQYLELADRLLFYNGGFKISCEKHNAGSTEANPLFSQDNYIIGTVNGIRLTSDRNASGGQTASTSSFSLTPSQITASRPIDDASDARLKNSISYDISFYKFFDELKPAIYKLNSSGDDKFNIGFIAQDVIAALADSGLGVDGYSIVSEFDDIESGESRYGLSYSQFIAVLTQVVQDLRSRVSYLEGRLAQE